MKKGSAKAVPAGKRTAAEKLQYVKKNWQLYVFFLLPALLLTIIFKYVPMGGVLIAFEDPNIVIKCKHTQTLDDPLISYKKRREPFYPPIKGRVFFI